MATYLSFSERALVSRPPRVRRSLPPPAAPAQLVRIEGGDLARRQRPAIAQELDEHLELLDFLDLLDLRRLGTRLQNVFPGIKQLTLKRCIGHAFDCRAGQTGSTSRAAWSFARSAAERSAQAVRRSCKLHSTGRIPNSRPRLKAASIHSTP